MWFKDTKNLEYFYTRCFDVFHFQNLFMQNPKFDKFPLLYDTNFSSFYKCTVSRHDSILIPFPKMDLNAVKFFKKYGKCIFQFPLHVNETKMGNFI